MRLETIGNNMHLKYTTAQVLIHNTSDDQKRYETKGKPNYVLSKTWLPARDNKERSTRDRRAVKCIANAEFQFIQIHGRTLT